MVCVIRMVRPTQSAECCCERRGNQNHKLSTIPSYWLQTFFMLCHFPAVCEARSRASFGSGGAVNKGYVNLD